MKLPFSRVNFGRAQYNLPVFCKIGMDYRVCLATTYWRVWLRWGYLVQFDNHARVRMGK